MIRQHLLSLTVLGLLVRIVWGLPIATLLSAHMSPAPRAVFKATITIGETPMPTLAPTSIPRRNLLLLWTPTPIPTARTTAMFQLPALYVDGPYIKQSNTKTPVWLNEVNIEEFRQRNPHIFSDLYNVQGLRIAISEKWNVNLIRVAVDPESVESTSHEIERLITFAEEDRMYIILTPFAGAVNPSRYDHRLTVPDDLIATAMGYLADKFRDRTNVHYGLWNELHPDSIPSIGYDQQWQTWMDTGIKVAKSIRSNNPKSILVVPGGTKWARDQTFYKGHPFPFDNFIYDIHDYSALPDYNYNREMWTWAIGKYSLLVGELGGNPINPSDPASIDYMKETL